MRIITALRSNKIRNFIKVLFFSLLMLSRPVYSSTLTEKKEEHGKLKQNKSSFIFLPIIYYTPETKIAGGVGGIYYFRTSGKKSNSRPSSILADVVYTQEKQVLLEFYPDLYMKNGEYHLVGSLRYRKYSEKFYGIGNNTSNDMEEIYSFRNAQFNISFLKKVYEKLYVGMQYELEHNRITEVKEDGQLANLDIVGEEGGLASGLGVTLNWDSRNNIFYPTEGRFVQISAKIFKRAFGSRYIFNKYNLDFRQYFPLFSSHALALQGYINVITGDPPFQMLSLLGGQNIMRGYYKGRFRDKNGIVLQIEYRIPIWWRLGLVGFVGYGDVADDIKNFKIRSFKYTVGWGIRYKINRKEGTNLRVDFGFGRESSGVYFTVNEAF